MTLDFCLMQTERCTKKTVTVFSRSKSVIHKKTESVGVFTELT